MQQPSDIARVSVIIPCYNAAKYLADTVASVLGQTYANLEVILIDDGSTDDSQEVLAALDSIHNVTVVRQVNAGVSVARNNGIAIATGELIAFLDADDWMYPENIEKKVAMFADPGVDVVYSAAHVTDEKLNVQSLFKGAEADKIQTEVWKFTMPPVPSPSSVVVRKKAVIAVGLFDPALSVSADLDLWIRLSFQHRFVKVPLPLIKYRLVPGSMNTNISGQIHDLSAIIRKYAHRPELRSSLNEFKRRFYYSVMGNSWLTRRYARLFNYARKYLFVRWKS